MVDKKINLTQGGIYLAKLDPAKYPEIGKIRPVIIITTTLFLNINPSVALVCPVSSKSYPDLSGLHVELAPRDNLRKKSFALIEHCRSVAIQRITSAKLAQLTHAELSKILSHLQRWTAL